MRRIINLATIFLLVATVSYGFDNYTIFSPWIKSGTNITTAVSTDNVGIGTDLFGSGVGVLSIKNAITVPTITTGTGFIMYSLTGNPTYRTGTGTVIGLNQSLMTTDDVMFRSIGVNVAPTIGNLNLSNTINPNKYGIIQKNGTRFLHNFNYGNNGTVTTDGYNIFLGENAGNFTMGSTATTSYGSSYNTAIGNSSLYSNTTGYFNTAIGSTSLYSNTTGLGLVAIGYQAGYGDGTVNQGSIIDNYATFLGYQASRDASVAPTTALTNITAIGKNARVSASNTIILGGTGADAVNVGIGTTSPSALLELYTPAGSSPSFRLSDGDVTLPNYSSAGFSPALGTSNIGAISSYNTSTGGIQVQGFTSSGINNGTPLAFVGYHGGNAPTTAAMNIVGYKWDGATSRTALASSEIVMQVSNTISTPLVTVLGSGNVGIGTTNPANNLTIQGSSGNTTFLGIRNSDFVNGSVGSGMLFGTGAASGNTYGQISAFTTGNTGYGNIVIPGGNVGIGTTGPGSALTVSKGAGTTIRIDSDTTGAASNLDFGALTESIIKARVWGTKNGADGGQLHLGTAQSGTGTMTDRLMIDQSGNVGIGGSPGSLLSVSQPSGADLTGLQFITSGVATDNDQLKISWYQRGTQDAVTREIAKISSILESASSHGGRLAFSTMGNTVLAERMRIDNVGNVGIGTTNPGAALEVQGANAANVIFNSNALTTANPIGVKIANALPSTATNSYNGGLVRLTVANNIAAINGFNVENPTNTSGTITNFSAFNVPEQTHGTNIYGFHGSISSGTNKYNLYLDGTAQNYIAGNVGIGTVSPTAALHIKAGTATANTAPLKLTTGVNLTTPEAGAMEYVTPKLTITDGAAVRQELVQAAYGSLYENGAGTNITLTTAGTWYQWITSTVGGQSNLVTESDSAGTNSLTIATGGDGVYRISLSVVTAGANNIQTHWAACKGGVPLVNIELENFLTGATSRSAASVTGIVRLIAGNVIDARVSSLVNGDVSTQYHVGLTMDRIGR